MSRKKGDLAIGISYDVAAKKPFDAKTLVSQLSDLTNPATWQVYDASIQETVDSFYKGMIVSVANDTEQNNGLYRLKGADPTVIENWEKTGGNAIKVWTPTLSGTPPLVTLDQLVDMGDGTTGQSFTDTSITNGTETDVALALSTQLPTPLSGKYGLWVTYENVPEDEGEGIGLYYVYSLFLTEADMALPDELTFLLAFLAYATGQGLFDADSEEVYIADWNPREDSICVVYDADNKTLEYFTNRDTTTPLLSFDLVALGITDVPYACALAAIGSGNTVSGAKTFDLAGVQSVLGGAVVIDETQLPENAASNFYQLELASPAYLTSLGLTVADGDIVAFSADGQPLQVIQSVVLPPAPDLSGYARRSELESKLDKPDGLDPDNGSVASYISGRGDLRSLTDFIESTTALKEVARTGLGSDLVNDLGWESNAYQFPMDSYVPAQALTSTLRVAQVSPVTVVNSESIGTIEFVDGDTVYTSLGVYRLQKSPLRFNFETAKYWTGTVLSREVGDQSILTTTGLYIAGELYTTRNFAGWSGAYSMIDYSVATEKSKHTLILFNDSTKMVAAGRLLHNTVTWYPDRTYLDIFDGSSPYSVQAIVANSEVSPGEYRSRLVALGTHPGSNLSTALTSTSDGITWTPHRVANRNGSALVASKSVICVPLSNSTVAFSAPRFLAGVEYPRISELGFGYKATNFESGALLLGSGDALYISGNLLELSRIGDMPSSSQLLAYGVVKHGTTGDYYQVSTSQIAIAPTYLASGVPSTPTSAGRKGQMAADSDYLYVCVATDSWISVPKKGLLDNKVDKVQAKEILTADKTLTAADSGKLLIINDDGITITMPANSNFNIDIAKMDEDFTTIVQAAGTDKFREGTSTISVIRDVSITNSGIVGKEWLAIGAYEV